MSKGTAFGLLAVGFSIYAVYRLTEESNKEIQAIEEEADAQIKAMKEAAKRVQDKIKAGYYDTGGMDAILNDFDFETIVAREK